VWCGSGDVVAVLVDAGAVVEAVVLPDVAGGVGVEVGEGAPDGVAAGGAAAAVGAGGSALKDVVDEADVVAVAAVGLPTGVVAAVDAEAAFGGADVVALDEVVLDGLEVAVAGDGGRGAAVDLVGEDVAAEVVP